MSRFYQDLDAPHFDYRLGTIAGAGGDLLFRGPIADTTRPFVACIGAAQTFGRFVERPFPALLGRALDVPCVNAGVPGTGPRFWLQPEVLAAVNSAQLVIVQVLAGRSASNSMYTNTGGGHDGIVAATGERLRFEAFLARVMASGDAALLDRVVAETRADYTATMRQLGESLRVPTVLLWLSYRTPAYRLDRSTPFGVLNHFPQLVDQDVIDAIRPAFGAFVDCTSSAGVPQRLWRTTAPVDGTELGVDGYLYNQYYPTPAMHELAAERLVPVCRRLLAR